MGKLTDEQAKALAELQALADAPDDEEEYEVWVKNDKGAETRVPSKRAASWLKEQFGITLHDEPKAEEEEVDEEEEDATKDKKPQTDFFGRRKG